MTDRLVTKVALISGGASGIGAATARAMVAEGACVLIADIADDQSASVADGLGEAASWVHLDVTEAASWENAVTLAEERFGKLNVLVNSAGVLEGATISDLELSTWNRTIAINLTGPMLGTKAALAALIRAQPASIINISSAAGIFGVGGQHAYTASKFGLRGLTKSLALELSDSGVRVNSVHPGSVQTPMTAAAMEPYIDILAQVTDLRMRPGRAEEIAALNVYLASDESSFSTGAEFLVDGGLTAGMVMPG